MLGSRCRPQNDALSVTISRWSAHAEAQCAVVFISGRVVTYRDQQAYPAYLVTFKARPGVSPMQAHVPPTSFVRHLQAVQARIQATMMQAQRVAAATVAGSGGSNGGRGGGGGGLPKVATCSVAACSREAWNGHPGQQCCRTCHISNGCTHGPDCDRKAAGGGGSGPTTTPQSGPQIPPGRPPHGAPRGGGGGGSGGGGVAGFGYRRPSSPPPRASSDDDYEEESDEGDVDDEDDDEEGESAEDDDSSRDPWGDEDDDCDF